MANRTVQRTSAPAAGPHFPAYGPLEGVFGFVLFYVIVDRTTPMFVSVLSELQPGIPAETVRTIFAASLWVVAVLTFLGQLRRQVTALGLANGRGTVGDVRRPGLLDGRRALGYGVLLLLGWLFVAVSWESALATAVDLIPIVGFQDVDAFDPFEFVVMVAFFVAYGVATRALDRLLVGGVRYALEAESDEE